VATHKIILGAPFMRKARGWGPVAPAQPVANLEPEGHAFTRAIKAARTARFRSAEGRSEGAAEATELPSSTPPPSYPRRVPTPDQPPKLGCPIDSEMWASPEGRPLSTLSFVNLAPVPDPRHAHP
jgi:hypothetical protein